MIDKTAKPDTRGKGAGLNDSGVVHRKDSDFRHYMQDLSEDFVNSLIYVYECTGDRDNYRKRYHKPLKEVCTTYRTSDEIQSRQKAVDAKVAESDALGYPLRSGEAKAMRDAEKKLAPLMYPTNLNVRDGSVGFLPNGVLSLDEDKGKTTTDGLITLGAFHTVESISGQGTSSLWRYDPALDYKEVARAVERYVGVQFDAAAIKPKQGVYVSGKAYRWEEKNRLYINSAFLAEFGDTETRRGTEQPKPRSKRRGHTTSTSEEDAELGNFATICEIERIANSIKTPFVGGKRNNHTKNLYYLCGKAGTDRDVLDDYVEANLTSHDFTMGEIRKTCAKRYKKGEDDRVKEEQELLDRLDARGYEFHQIGGGLYYTAGDEAMPWSIDGVRRYLKKQGRDVESEIRYIPGGFTFKPDNLNFERIITNERGECWNLAQPAPTHERHGGRFDTILNYLKHLCALSWNVEHLLDYLYICYKFPQQSLQCLVLTSFEGGTGKTSLLRFFRVMLGEKNVFIGEFKRLEGRFTANYAMRQILGLEESTSDKKADNEAIKNIVTADTIEYEQKSRPSQDIPCYLKVIMCNNSEDKPIFLTPQDRRYTVLRVKRLDAHDPQFMAKIKNEMGDFLHWLLNERTFEGGRHTYNLGGEDLFFAQDVINTKHTLAAMDANTPLATQHVRDLIGTLSDLHPDVKEFPIVGETVAAWVQQRNKEISSREVLAALRREFGEPTRLRNAEVWRDEFNGARLSNWELTQVEGQFRVYTAKAVPQ